MYCLDQMPFEFTTLAIPEVIGIQPKIFSDDRGTFAELFRQRAFAEAGIQESFRQVNSSVSKTGVVRGLHYQLPPAAQGKLVMAIEGRLFDVIVDIRKSSSTFGHSVTLELSAAAKNMVYVPPGFAHGFCALSENAQALYFTTEEYAPEQERGIRWNDPALSIAWPIAAPIVNERDSAWPLLAAASDLFD